MFSTQLVNAVSTAAAAHSPGLHWGGPWGGGFHWFFLIVPLLWIALIVFLVTFFARRRRAAWRDAGYNTAHAAEQTLAERFAHGDIEEVEYRARLEVLRANRLNGA